MMADTTLSTERKKTNKTTLGQLSVFAPGSRTLIPISAKICPKASTAVAGTDSKMLARKIGSTVYVSGIKLPLKIVFSNATDAQEPAAVAPIVSHAEDK